MHRQDVQDVAKHLQDRFHLGTFARVGPLAVPHDIGEQMLRQPLDDLRRQKNFVQTFKRFYQQFHQSAAVAAQLKF